MTPTQRVKCDLLNISIQPWNITGGGGWYVIKGNIASRMEAYLCTPVEGTIPIAWDTKKFKTINAAIEAASNPSKFGLAWDN